MRKHRALWLWSTFIALLAIVTLAGLEVLASFVVPPWPARELRPIDATNLPSLDILASTNTQPHYNSWGENDRERSVQKPAGTEFRTVMVGDSFLEGAFVTKPVGTRVEQLLQAQGHRDMEIVNLGVSATAPPQYYYRIRNVALSLQPDAIVVIFFSGNDFVRERLSWTNFPPPIAERPLPSWLGAIAPRLTWLVVNRLGLSEFGRAGVRGVDMVREIMTLPRAERVDAMVRFVKTYYYPEKDERVIREILARGGDRFWDAFERRNLDQEYLQGWWMASMVDWETGTWPTPLTKEEFDRSVRQEEIDSTLSWLVGARDLARERSVKFMVALAPVPVVDPTYAEFWSPWPRYRSYPMLREASHRALRKELEAKGVTTVDLQDDFAGVRDTYRISDGHWTELGTDIAAKRLAAELIKLRGNSSRESKP